MLVQLAFRNLARHKIKTILSVLAITVSVAVFIFVDGWVEGMSIDSKRNIVNYETGAAKLQKKAYVDKLDEAPMYESFTGWEDYAASLHSAGYNAAPRFTFSGTLYSSTGSAPVVFNGIDPALDKTVFQLSTAIEQGHYIKDGAYEILLGNMTADKLKLGIPLRPTIAEFNRDILPLFADTDKPFIQGLYTEAVYKAQAFAPPDLAANVKDRLILRSDLSKEDMDKAWSLFDATGRNTARISTVIDILDANGELRHVNQLIDVRLAGTINAPDPQVNNNMAYIPLDVLQDDNGMMLNGAVTELAIRKQGAAISAIPGKDESPEAITQAMAGTPPTQPPPQGGRSVDSPPLAGGAGGGVHIIPPDMAVFNWQTYCQDFMAASTGDTWSTRIIVGILFIISFLVIANTMLLAILERTKEIGMMRAQGMTGTELIRTMMLESGLSGLIGAVAGLVIGCIVNAWMVEYGLDFSAMTESLGGDIGYRVNGVFKSTWNFPVIIGTGIAATVLSAFMAFIPTRRVLKMEITESLRFE
jgi:ABC-type lipoprotein release transport system permease subunit